MAALTLILRRLRTLFWTVLSIVVISAALLVGVGKILMPYSGHFQPRLEAWLSKEFGQVVTLTSFTGEWKTFGPRLSLQGLRLQARAGGVGEVAIDKAALDIKPLNLLIPGTALYNFLVIGADFKLIHATDGQYVLSGLGVAGTGASGETPGLRSLVGIGELILENSNLEYVDEKYGVRLNLSEIDARVQFDGNVLALALQARLTDEDGGRVFGEVDASGILLLAETRGIEEARWQVTLRELLLGPVHERLPTNPFLLKEGKLSAELWCDWRTGQALSVSGVVDLRKGRLENGQQRIAIDHLNTWLAWSYGGKADWRLDLSNLAYDDGVHSWTAPSVALARNLERNLGLWISADYLPLDVPLRLARDIMSIYGTPWPSKLPKSAAGGVSGLELILDRNWRLQLALGTARQASIADWGRWPDLQGLDGTIDLRRGFGHMSLHAGRLDVQWPQMFAGPLAFSLPGCEIDLTWGEHWQVGLQQCQLLNEDIAVSGEALFAGNDGRPAVDVNVEVSRGKLGELSPYWPEGILKTNVVQWLRRGLLDGDLVTGRFQILGDMDDWPFRSGLGRFEAIAQIDAASLDYAPTWPVATKVDAIARFTGPSLAVEATVGDIAGVAVQRVTATIADLKQPLLRLEYEAQSQLDTLMGFLARSPLQQKLEVNLDRFEFSGRAETLGSLQVPLGRTAGELSVDGQVEMQDNKFSDPGSGVVLEAINGKVYYTRQGLTGSGLKALFKGEDAQLELRGNTDAPERFRVDMTGRFEVKDILPEFLLEARTVLGRVQGASDWQVSVVVPALVAGEESQLDLFVRSELAGIALDFPTPFDKPESESWPLVLHYPLKGPSGLLDVELDGRILLRLELPRSTGGSTGEVALSRALIQLGNGTGSLPPPGFARINGLAPTLDLDGWVDIIIEAARSGGGLAGLKLERCDLAAGSLRFLDRQFENVNLSLSINDADIKATFAGEDIEGNVTFTPDPGKGQSLSAEFERLALGVPLSSGVDMEANPGNLPALHLYAHSFSYAGVELGETRIEAYPVSNGFHFEKVESESGELRVRASGDWSLSDAGQRSDFNILITAESLGALMHSLDISSALQGGQTVLRFNAWWPGSPATFALSRLNGEVEFSVSGGQIANASPGTGRVLGLLSIQALPRRLSLDFRDVFDSGFDFDEAKGTFHLENGTASTDDVELSSTAAKINLTGSTDLVAQRYDQLMTVRPGVGNTLPIIGAIAGGPAGAAAGAALQGLLQGQLGTATQAQYTITGSWDEPVIEPRADDDAGG
ncbi:MAG TPA: YhdP family protein [Xanthomonadales bacterium]|nr:YhdP family protein [Xanthomonadales bacterium]